MTYAAFTYGFIGAHGEEVCHEGGEARSEAALRHKAQLQLSQTHGVIASLPVPARNIQKVSLPTGDNVPAISRVIHVHDCVHVPRRCTCTCTCTRICTMNMYMCMQVYKMYMYIHTYIHANKQHTHICSGSSTIASTTVFYDFTLWPT